MTDQSIHSIRLFHKISLVLNPLIHLIPWRCYSLKMGNYLSEKKR